MDSLYGCYQRSPGVLKCFLTNQALCLVEENQQTATFDYVDAEISERVSLSFRYPDASLGWKRLIDVNWPEHSPVRASYGHWRRLTFFLLDALLAFYAEESDIERQVGSVTIAGGWFNGSWQDGGRFEASMVDGGDELVGEVRPFSPFPLDAQPANWRFECGLEGARIGNIRIASSPSISNGELPCADLTIPVTVQLADVPRCVSTAGEIFFFNKVVPYQGPEYSPGMVHGLCTEGYAFFFSDYHADLRGLPIKMRPDASVETAVVWIESRSRRMPSARAILHPLLRERLLFAGVDAYTAMSNIPRSDMPMVADLEHGQEMQFNPRCNHLSLSPLSTGIGFIGIAGYPPASIASWYSAAAEREKRESGGWTWRKLFGQS